MADAELDRARPVGAGRPVGRLAVLRALRPVDREPQPQHVDADRHRHRVGVRLQRRRDGRARCCSRTRSSRRDGSAVYFEAAVVIISLTLLGQLLELKARSQTSAAIKSLLGLAPKTARRIEADGTEEDVALSHVHVGDSLRVRPGREGARGRRGDRGQERGGRIDADRRTDAREQGAGRQADRRHAQHQRRRSSCAPRRVGCADDARADRADGRAGTALAGADAAHGGHGRRLVRAGGGRRRARRRSSSGVSWVRSRAGSTASSTPWRCSSSRVRVRSGWRRPCRSWWRPARAATPGRAVPRCRRHRDASRTVDTLIVDKTGTLTEGKPAFDRAVPVDGVQADEVLRLAASLEQGSEHPLADAIVRAARERGLALDKRRDVRVGDRASACEDGWRAASSRSATRRS